MMKKKFKGSLNRKKKDRFVSKSAMFFCFFLSQFPDVFVSDQLSKYVEVAMCVQQMVLL